MGKIRIGISGWSYKEWKGGFYPDDLADDDQLEFAARVFDTIEINGTFYSLTDPATCSRWRDATPRDFQYAVKGSRYISHNLRLNDARPALANFFASGVLELGDRLGPFLWQLPQNFKFDGERLDSFLGMLPKDTEAAAVMARDHDDRVEDVSYGPGERHLIRHALEIRHYSFLQPEMARIAQRHGVALCSSHSSEWPYIEEITAGFIYLRLHGPRKLYASQYSESALDRWADRIETWNAGEEPDDAERISDLEPPSRKERDVYVYFDNTAHGHAPMDAQRLMDRISE
ncbi:MAG TPA: DUF72 domain-containing protein [Acidimicrobiia bacterium]